MTGTHPAVGARLREVRRARGLSLSRLAAEAGVGKGTLSEIEGGTRNPTLETLYRLAGRLAVPLADLLAEGAGSTVADEVTTVTLLDARSDDAGTTVEVYRLLLDAGGTRRSPAHGAGVVEHLTATRGAFRVEVGDAVLDVATGTSARWTSDVPHAYTATSPHPAEAVLVITTPAPPAR
ncbi:helix-turn-helix domain-containing protein [Solicola sp. PLA-1-18]|uniref:helix-turn-helix domain-containing protein n=1 Tax=Solicola sp. PLA-1-18 TaxID=3380532 RepID=UPI003B788885